MTGRSLGVLLLLLAELSTNTLADPKVVSMPMRRKDRARLRSSKRGTPTVPLSYTRNLAMYEVDVTIGTPPQTLTLDIDTGSSDIWVFDTNVIPTCGGLCEGGTFNPNASSTYALTNGPTFGIEYNDGSSVSGTYFSDRFSMNGVSTITNTNLALVTQINDWALRSPSIMGIGFEHLEASIGAGAIYPGLTRLMVEQGLINTRSYSLWLDDQDASTGTLMFGGYDTSKYTGDLAVLDIQPSSSGAVNSMLVDWTSLVLATPLRNMSLTSDGFSVPALLDSGTSLTFLPTGIYETLATYFQPRVDAVSSLNLVNCQIGGGTLNFGFGGNSAATVAVPFAELAPLAFDSNGDAVMIDGETQACEFGIFPAQGGSVVLGDTFLRSAYVVYDLDAKQIGLAQSNFNATDSAANIVEIQSGSNPFATSAVSSVGPTIVVTSTAPNTAVVTSTPVTVAVSSTARTGVISTAGQSTSLSSISVIGSTATTSSSTRAPGVDVEPSPTSMPATSSSVAMGYPKPFIPSGTMHVMSAVTALFALGVMQVMFL